MDALKERLRKAHVVHVPLRRGAADRDHRALAAYRQDDTAKLHYISEIQRRAVVAHLL